MDGKLLLLVAYAMITCMIAVHARMKKYSLIYRAIWGLYALSAVFCVLCKVYQGTFVGFSVQHNSWYDLSTTTWWGYGFLTICNLIAFRPLKEFNAHKEIALFGKRKMTRNFFTIYAIIYLLLATIYILPSLSIIREVFGITDYGALRVSLYSNSENEGSAIISNNTISTFAIKMCLQFKLVSIIIAFAMIKERVRTPLAILLLGATFFLYLINCMATAARGGLLIFFFCTALIGLMFYPYLTHANKKRILVSGTILSVIVFLFFIAVTLSRTATDTGGGNRLLRNVSFYLGHAPIEFSKITGSLKDFAWGQTILGRLSNHYFGTPYSWEQIANSIGYPDIGALFVTYLGFIYTDFGMLGCLAFTIPWMLFMLFLLRKRPNNISTLFMLLYYIQFYVTGCFVVGRLEYAAVITSFIIYFIIRIIERTPTLRAAFTKGVKTSGRLHHAGYFYKTQNSIVQNKLEEEIPE